MSVPVRLTDIPNIGKRVAAQLVGVGITKPSQLQTQDPYQLYQTVCKKYGRQHGALLDVCMSAVAYLNGAPRTPWWFYTPDRKRLYPDVRLK